jgi:hypothetical protein
MTQIYSRYLTGRPQHERQEVVGRRSGRPWTENGPKHHRRRKKKLRRRMLRSPHTVTLSVSNDWTGNNYEEYKIFVITPDK